MSPAYRYIQFNIQWLEMAKLFLSAAAMSGTAWFVYNGMLPLMGNGIATIAAILLAAIIYVICLFVFRAIALDEAMRLPVIGNINKGRGPHCRKEGCLMGHIELVSVGADTPESWAPYGGTDLLPHMRRLLTIYSEKARAAI